MDHNLLVGILAVQMNLVRSDDLIQAMNAWLPEKHRPLMEFLPLPGERRTLLEALVAEHLKAHDGNARQVLTELSSVDWVRDAFKYISDEEVEQTINFIPVTEGTVQQVGASPAVQALAAKIGSRFRIIRPHARGGLGEVFVAEDTELGRQVALKEIQSQHAGNKNTRGRFMLEAEVTGGLEHPNIVPVYGLGTYADGRPYYAMRFIRGDSLKDVIERFYAPKQNERVTAERSLEFRNLLKRFIDVCNAIAYAHNRGILHRDLKPGNIMVGKYGETLVVDWGLAKSLSDGSQDAPHENHNHAALEPGERHLTPASGSYAETQAGSIVGTPAFMSPEQAQGKFEGLGPAADIYSLGVTLYVILTGKVPFAGGIAELLEKVTAGKFESPRSIKPETPTSLNAVVLKAMSMKPTDRYATATELAQEIERYLADESVTAIREPYAVRARRWGRKHPGIVAGLAASLLVGIIGLATGLYFVNVEKNLADQARNKEADQRIKADAARTQAVSQYNISLDTINSIAYGKWQKIPLEPVGHMQIDSDVLQTVRNALNRILSCNPDQGIPLRSLIAVCLRMGDMRYSEKMYSESLTEYEMAHSYAKRLLVIEPNSIARRDMCICLYRLGDCSNKLDRILDAEMYYLLCIPFAEQAVVNTGDAYESLDELACCYEAISCLKSLNKAAKTSDEYFRLCIETREKPGKPNGLIWINKSKLFSSFMKYGDIQIIRGNIDKGIDSYRKGINTVAAAGLPAQEASLAIGGEDTMRELWFRKYGDEAKRLGNYRMALSWYKMTLDLCLLSNNPSYSNLISNVNANIASCEIAVKEKETLPLPRQVK